MKLSTLRLTTAVISLTGLMTLSGFADDAISSSVTVSPPTKNLSGDAWRALSLASNRILKHADQAVAALTDKKNDSALTNIGQGLKLVQIINATMPATTVTTEIKSGGLSYTDNDLIKPAFVPIYREYDEVDIISPVTAQKQAKVCATGHDQCSRSTCKVTTAQKQVACATNEPEVTYAGFDYTGVKLDLRLAKRDLQTAEDLIKQGDTKGATATLQDIMATGVIFEFSTVDEPLVRAMDNLRLAESELKANHPDQAKVALAGVSDALKNYQALAGDSRAKDVAKLQKEIDEAVTNIAQEKPETFSLKVSDWWTRCRNWFKS